jgi:hypothetical protein
VLSTLWRQQFILVVNLQGSDVVIKNRLPSKFNWCAVVSGLVAVVIFCFWALWLSRLREPLFRPVPSHQEERLYTVSTGDVNFSLHASAFHSLKFVVPPHLGGVNLKGRFFVVGNTDGIEAFLVSEEDYGNWQSGYTTFRYYDSGTVRKGTLDVPLLAWSAGVYYLVFENRSTAETTKSIQANFNLTYSDMWWPGKTE